MKKVFVIGSNSFSGSDFIDLLLENADYEVIGISRSPEKPAVFLPYKRRSSPHFRFHQLDLNKNMPEIVGLIKKFEPGYIVNFAAQSEVAPSWKHPEHWFETNTVALAKLINFLKDLASLKRYVHISSPEVYGTCEGRITEEAPLNPSTPYAASKAAADLLLFAFVKTLNFPLVMIRATNVYGAHQQLWKILPRSVILLKQGKKIDLHGGGVAVKSFIHIRDVSRGELAAMERGQAGEIYHLSPDRGVAVRDAVRMICDRLNCPFDQFTRAVEERLGQDRAYIIDSSRARNKLNWKPEVQFTQGIDGVIEWVNQDWDFIRQQPLEYDHKA